MQTYAYPWKNPMILVLGQIDVKIGKPRLPIVQSHEGLVSKIHL